MQFLLSLNKNLQLTFRPSKREIARKGLSALNVLSERKAAKSERTVRLRMDIWKIKYKYNMFVQYIFNTNHGSLLWNILPTLEAAPPSHHV